MLLLSDLRVWMNNVTAFMLYILFMRCFHKSKGDASLCVVYLFLASPNDGHSQFYSQTINYKAG